MSGRTEYSRIEWEGKGTEVYKITAIPDLSDNTELRWLKGFGYVKNNPIFPPKGTQIDRILAGLRNGSGWRLAHLEFGVSQSEASVNSFALLERQRVFSITNTCVCFIFWLVFFLYLTAGVWFTVFVAWYDPILLEVLVSDKVADSGQKLLICLMFIGSGIWLWTLGKGPMAVNWSLKDGLVWSAVTLPFTDPATFFCRYR